MNHYKHNEGLKIPILATLNNTLCRYMDLRIDRSLDVAIDKEVYITFQRAQVENLQHSFKLAIYDKLGDSFDLRTNISVL